MHPIEKLRGIVSGKDTKMSRREFSELTGLTENVITKIETGRKAKGCSLEEALMITVSTGVDPRCLQGTKFEENPPVIAYGSGKEYTYNDFEKTRFIPYNEEVLKKHSETVVEYFDRLLKASSKAGKYPDFLKKFEKWSQSTINSLGLKDPEKPWNDLPKNLIPIKSISVDIAAKSNVSCELEVIVHDDPTPETSSKKIPTT